LSVDDDVRGTIAAQINMWTKRWIWASAGVLLFPVLGLRTVRELAPLSFFGMLAAVLVSGRIDEVVKWCSGYSLEKVRPVSWR